MGASQLCGLPSTAVVVHGGMHKTGSSAIQNALHAHRADLAVAGWLYPGAGMVDQASTGHRHRQLMAEARGGPQQTSWDRLREEIRPWPGRVIISHENFFSPQVDPGTIAAQLPDRPVYLLAYLRHPVDYIESCYREWVRRWRYRHSIRRFYAERRDYLDVRPLRSAWQRTFGADHVALRPYDRSQLVGGTVLSDFAAALGLDIPWTAPARSANESLSTGQTFVHLVSNRVCGRSAVCEAIAAAVGATVRPQRIADDALVGELRAAHLGTFQAVLAEHGAPADALGHSAFADLPEDTLFRNRSAARAVEELLGA